jgi:membrane fusion protein (multidrug efflux system)
MSKKLYVVRSEKNADTPITDEIKAKDASTPGAVAQPLAQTSGEGAPRRKRGRSFLLGASAIILVAAGAYYGHDYW